MGFDEATVYVVTMEGIPASPNREILKVFQDAEKADSYADALLDAHEWGRVTIHAAKWDGCDLTEAS